ncbi:BREX-1 system adenine-specific DNA-methyltransferase PglX [Virgibacillus ndiopensis]|uniref:BREX-1 system adenine-specific DNA-methyltransferase PglX n=1 Tax=Virgibacillus ndiopensis TaxID=2004408 RepID=UPI000C08D1FB|nr:BREX-1 system adenine-specific DNA-methyltransferase PglX [Virgibacillus ndiopensis]
MNKAELKKFAVEARRDLIDKVSLKAEQYGITDDHQELNIEENYGQLIVNGKSFLIEIKHAVHTFQQRLNRVGYDQLIEEVAYTWFNRIIAIRYMEVNNYLPDRVNVLSSSTGKNEPDILLQYKTMNLDVDREQINEWLQKGDNEQAYRTLFIAQCNALNQLLPFLFEKIEDYTELLLPDYLLDQESIIRKMVNDLSDENFYQIQENGSRKDNVEVLGWLYQYYMSEKKEQVGGLRNNAVKKEDLPVVTQLFTPKWIVQYMVQNSLGKLYDEKYENNQLAQQWEYYLKHEENHHLYPEFDSLEELKIMDPACGSGHILLYAFDMLYDMYEEAGYPTREIPQLILENNLYGLDIDKRAQQIANFALLMKAAEKQPRFISKLSRKGKSTKLNVYEIVDADQSLSDEAIDYFADNETEKSLVQELLSQFENGKQFGSLINPIEIPYEEWVNRLYDLEKKQSDLIDESYINELREKLLPVLEQANMLYQKYDVIVTNPPYHNKYNPLLKSFMNQSYKNYKSDLYSSFIYKTTRMTKSSGYSALMTPYTWMFISSHQKLRNFVLNEAKISSLVQLEYSAFEEATVPICTFVIQNQVKQTLGHYIRLDDFKGSEMQPIKLHESVVNPNVKYRYRTFSSSFSDISGSPIAYWSSEQVRKLFRESISIGEIAEPKQGLATGNNDRFLRWWFEPSFKKIYEKNIDNYKWVPVSKGGAFRKWYGNRNFVVDWEENGKELKNFKGSVIRNPTYYFREGLTWSTVSSSNVSFRYHPDDSIFETKGSVLFPKDIDQLKTLFGYLNSKLVNHFLKSISPTLDYHEGPIGRLPYIPTDNDRIEQLVSENINISKADWNSYEISWDFIAHPFIVEKLNSTKLSKSYEKWKNECEKRFKSLKKNEELLNELFIELYNLKDELDPSIEVKYISVTKADYEKDTKSFLSYFIGCVMGRYSLDMDGLTFAGGEFNELKYKSFKPNSGGLIQITDDHYFDNDIISRLREFLSVAFSPDTVDENMQWLAESLTMKKNESPEERLRRYFLDEFFKDHCKTYQKRPIYWLVDSGKQKGLRTLIYMHRYQPDTMATIRFEHLQEIQSKYQNEISMIDTRLANLSLSATDRRSLEKAKTDYQKKLDEIQEFDKQLATYANEQIDIDLDDGVKVNYAKFDKVLAKIK